ncbi:uncharacterized protein [Penaeus vannamei]|uniref:uncharacterized protein n=1 Tax=Penaeus vannamei TaxID=6689 RepID=UPI00387F7505
MEQRSIVFVCVEDLGACATTGDSLKVDDSFGNNSGSFVSTDVSNGAITYTYSEEEHGDWITLAPDSREDYKNDTRTSNRNKGSVSVQPNMSPDLSNVSRGMGARKGDGAGSDSDDERNATTRFRPSRRLVISPPCLPCHQWDGLMYCRPVFGCVQDALSSKMEDAACRPCFQRNDLNECERIRGCIIPILHGAPNVFQGGVVLPSFRKTTTPSSGTSQEEAVDTRPPPTETLAPADAAAVVPLLKTFLTTLRPQETRASRPPEASQANRVSDSTSNHAQRSTLSSELETTRHEIGNDVSFGASGKSSTSSAVSVASEAHVTQSENQARATLTQIATEASGLSFISERSQVADSSSEILETSEMPSASPGLTATPAERTELISTSSEPTATVTASSETGESTFMSYETESTATSYGMIELTAATTEASDFTSAETEATSEESVATTFGLESTSMSSSADLNSKVSERGKSTATLYEIIESSLKSETEPLSTNNERNQVTVSISEMLESTVVYSDISESTFQTSELESTATSEKGSLDTPCAMPESTYASSEIMESTATTLKTIESTSLSSEVKSMADASSQITESTATADSESSGKPCERKELTFSKATESTATAYGSTKVVMTPESFEVVESQGVTFETTQFKTTPFNILRINGSVPTDMEATSERAHITATFETAEPTEPEIRAATTELMELTITSLETSKSTEFEGTATTSEMMESTITSLKPGESPEAERTVSTVTWSESSNLTSSSCDPVESSQLMPAEETESTFNTIQSRDTIIGTGYALKMPSSTVIHQRSPGTATVEDVTYPPHVHASHPDAEVSPEEATGPRPEAQFSSEAAGLMPSESAHQEADLTTLGLLHAEGFPTPHAKPLYTDALVTSKTPNPDAEVFTVTQTTHSNTESFLTPKTPNPDAEVFMTSRKKTAIIERLILSPTTQKDSQSMKPLYTNHVAFPSAKEAREMYPQIPSRRKDLQDSSPRWKK